MSGKERTSLIDNIQNCNLLPSNVVVSAIQGLCHSAARGDEKLLLPLLDHHDKSIAAALSSLCFHFGFSKKLINRIVQFASEYPTLFNQLIKIAENYHNTLECSGGCYKVIIWKIVRHAIVYLPVTKT